MRCAWHAGSPWGAAPHLFALDRPEQPARLRVQRVPQADARRRRGRVAEDGQLAGEVAEHGCWPLWGAQIDAGLARGLGVGTVLRDRLERLCASVVAYTLRKHLK